MPAYEIFGRFYDAVMGDRAGAAEQLQKLIRTTTPNATNVLELGCGTGSILWHLQRNYEVSGLDTSKRMLSVARHKVPQAKLFRQDMVDFHINDQFDVIYCVFDSINHVGASPTGREFLPESSDICRRAAVSSSTSTQSGSSNATLPSRRGCIGLETTS